ncbi:MAG: tripartite tricarboxylate transporter substrate binding protein [Bradyrhizobium sp.]|nr:tripartite tricarboxylate transporter substrate binding protein [Bradyrhizobium sp.]
MTRAAREDGMKKTALITAFALLAGLSLSPAQAQSWPDKQITFIVPFAAGGGTDAFARPLAAQLDTQLGKRVLIENRAGAGGTVGAAAAAKAAPDGYTFFVGAAHHAIAPSLYPKLDYDFEKDFVAVALIARPPQVVVVNPDKVAAKTLKEFIDYLRANPGKLHYGSAGAGTTHHLAGELFKILTKTDIQHVPYRGAGPAMQDLIAGHVPVVFDGLGSSAGPVRAGQLRALAVAAPKRVAAFPDLPTAAEAGVPGYEVSTWYGLFAPKNTPPEIVARMTKELRAAMQTASMKEAWERNGSDVPDVTGADFAKMVSAEVARWRKVVNEANVKLD